MLWLYNISIHLYALLIRIFSTFNTKASLFIKGRKNIFTQIDQKIVAGERHIWFHFASLGEFEQGRTLLEKIKEHYPEKRIVITFFSPSGYEIRKNYPLAEGVFYLPLDTAVHAEKLIAAFNPEFAIFTKYEYWYHYFRELNKKNIPLLIISGIFRPNQVFFKVYGSFHRKILTFVSHFFVQNEESIQLLKTINIQNASLSGDTRFDRVAENAASVKRLALVNTFCGTAAVCIAGSTWPEDEELMGGLCVQHPDWKFIIAPHEIGEAHLKALEKIFPQAVKYSALAAADANQHQVLIIDNIGMLSALYAYGRLAYIGGGFGAGIHNTLEAAAFGIPVIFGPRYDKFQEAKDLIALGAAKSIGNPQELSNAFEELSTAAEKGDVAKAYVVSKTGSTDQILQYIARHFKP
ncbi:3-deoxy-D-manno-octulosonic acid transferase [Pedobacter heparinus]|uniref:3-deoxy-D-manno-octulosonic acid transferase n=1 Tax=Pedobacter heparinus TaxID=984 RepID=UPI00292EDF95|nr:glycosyltransferase N-terminal domain-containing protein [Pedobacter heparinus]